MATAPAPTVLKEGFLKKQGGRMRTWKNRWFVIYSNGNMAYFSPQEKTKKINEFNLHGTDLNVIANDPYDTANGIRYLFEIKCGEKGGKLTSFHENFLFWAATDKERDEWVSVLKKVLYRHRGGAVFGYPLEEIMAAESKKGYFVPRLVKELVEFIDTAGLDIEGIFRLGGRQKLINQLIDEYDRGEDIDLAEKNVDVHTAASVLKAYLRQLPEPLVPFSRFEEMSTYGSKFSIPLADMSEVHNLVISGLSSLPVWNYNLLKYIICFLRQVSLNVSVNKMSVSNLAAIHAPNILRMEYDTPELLATINLVITETTSAFIEHFDILFTRDYCIPEEPAQDNANSSSSCAEANGEGPSAPLSNAPTAEYFAEAIEHLKGLIHEEQKRRRQLEDDLMKANARNTDLVTRVQELEKENGRLTKRLSEILERHGALA